MVMTKSSQASCAAGFLAAVVGALAGTASWALADRARRYCGAYQEGQRNWLSTSFFELPLAIAGGALVAFLSCGAIHLIARNSVHSGVRAVVTTALVILVLALMAWGHFAWLGTPAGGVSDSGRCPESNIPGWWPTWLPA